MTPSDPQADAIRSTVSWFRNDRKPVWFGAGYAGTGKSTTIGFILAELGVRAVISAYTGKAAHVLRRKGIDAQTLHSLIYAPVPDSDPVRFELNHESELYDADLLVIDEGSMINDEMCDDLLSFGKKILVLGDPGQLPPIRGVGAFVRRPPDFFLHEIHRQAAESPILRLATAARLGQPLPATLDEPGAAIRRVNVEDALREDHQVICGVHRVRWNVTAKIRKARGYQGQDPLSGERVLCCRNNREAGLYNGAMGTVVGEPQVTHTDQLRLRIQMEDHAAAQRLLISRVPFREHAEGRLPAEPYSRQVDLYDFGYALTCHKAQGSEWDNVVVIDDSESFREDRNRWLYTAITRAAKNLILLRR